MSNIKEFKIDNYLLIFNADIENETFNESSYYGIIFYINGNRYEIIHNYLMGNRILINTKEYWNDIPFKEATFWLLPSEIKVKEL